MRSPFRNLFDALVALVAFVIIIVAVTIVAIAIAPGAHAQQVVGQGELPKCMTPKAAIADAHKQLGKQFKDAKAFTKAEVAKLQAHAKEHGEDASEYDTYAVVYTDNDRAVVFAGKGGKVCIFVVVTDGEKLRQRTDDALKGKRA